MVAERDWSWSGSSGTTLDPGWRATRLALERTRLIWDLQGRRRGSGNQGVTSSILSNANLRDMSDEAEIYSAGIEWTGGAFHLSVMTGRATVARTGSPTRR